MVVFLKLYLLINNFESLRGAIAPLNEKKIVSSVVGDGDVCLFHEALG